MATTSIPDYPRNLTFEQVWAALMENREQLKETAREMRENAREAREMLEKEQKAREKEREMREKEREAREKAREKEREKDREEARERQKEIERQMKDTDTRLGKLGNRFGEMVEYMVMPCLLEKFRELGFVFSKAYPHATIEDEKNNIITEIDITLENGDKVMIVEVKSKLTTDDITDHVERMKKIRFHADLHNDKRIFLGAIAGIVMSKSEKIFALKNGFYVVEPSGETFAITVPEGVYAPKEW